MLRADAHTQRMPRARPHDTAASRTYLAHDGTGRLETIGICSLERIGICGITCRNGCPHDTAHKSSRARSQDARIPDAGIPDAGIPDAGIPDAGIPDAGIPAALLLRQSCKAQHADASLT